MIPPKTRSEMEHNFFLALEDFNERINSGDKDRIENAVWATAKHIERVKKHLIIELMFQQSIKVCDYKQI